MENARLLTETREALEQQTATAEVLQVINSSPGNLAPVFDAMLQKAHKLCGASFGALMTFDGESFYPIAVQGVPAEFRKIHRRWYSPQSGNPFAHLVEGARSRILMIYRKSPPRSQTILCRVPPLILAAFAVS